MFYMLRAQEMHKWAVLSVYEVEIGYGGLLYHFRKFKTYMWLFYIITLFNMIIYHTSISCTLQSVC